MTNEQRMSLLRLVFRMIFQSKASGTDITQVILTTNTGRFPGRWFNDSSTGQPSLRGFDFTCNLGSRIISIRCLEQNPNKVDNFGNLKKFAVLARQGHQIMWVINKNKAVDGFLGRIQDGEWVASFVPAVKPVGTLALSGHNYHALEHDLRVDAAYNHINHDWEDPNFKGVPGTSNYQPHIQSVDEALTEDLNIDGLPEIPDGITVPDYVYDQIANMDEPPDWDNYDE